LGSQTIKELSGDSAKMEARINEILESHFKPEFLNRIDEIVLFKVLTRDVLSQIVELQVDELRSRLEDKNIKVDVSLKAKELLAERGYDPVYGARPLKRIIQQDIQNPLALKILEGEYQEGDVIKITVSDKGEFTFKRSTKDERKSEKSD
jgi:ATP-dependent Clp protease ATP-binding subunit ClpB